MKYHLVCLKVAIKLEKWCPKEAHPTIPWRLLSTEQSKLLQPISENNDGTVGCDIAVFCGFKMCSADDLVGLPGSVQDFVHYVEKNKMNLGKIIKK